MDGHALVTEVYSGCVTLLFALYINWFVVLLLYINISLLIIIRDKIIAGKIKTSECISSKADLCLNK